MTAFTQSCSVENRLHLSGYSIDWKNQHGQKNKTLKSSEFTKNNLKFVDAKIDSITSAEITASIENLQPKTEKEIKTLIIGDSSNQTIVEETKCDTIELKNGNKILAKVLEIGLSDIKYKNCNYQDGPTIVLSKDITQSIKYKNGTTENIIKPEITKAPKKKFEFIGLGAFVLAIINAVASLILIDFLTGIYFIPAILGLSAIVLGIYSLITVAKNPDTFKKTSFAVLGIVFGAVVSIISFILMLNEYGFDLFF